VYYSPEHRCIDSESIPGAQATDLRPAVFGPFLLVLLRSSNGSSRASLAVRAVFFLFAGVQAFSPGFNGFTVNLLSVREGLNRLPGGILP